MKKTAILFFGLILFGGLICIPISETSANGGPAELESTQTVRPEIRLDESAVRASDRYRLTGSGFEKFELVTFSAELVEADGNRLRVASWAAVADESGSVSTEFAARYSGRFEVIASGTSSGQAESAVEVAAVIPVFVAGNPTCQNLNSSSDPAFAHVTQDWGFKVDPPAAGTFPFTNAAGRSLTGGAPADALNSLTISSLTSTTFNWSATKSITAVIVKGGPNSLVYPYDPESFGDTDLTTVGPGRFGISHIEVCFQNTLTPPATVTIIKDAQPNTLQSFAFSATGQVTQNFNLVDNGVVGPDRITWTGLTGFGVGNAINVQEALPGGFYQLTAINCTSSVTNNNTVSALTRSVQIVLEPGENVTCTFVNTVVTAAGASVAGTVRDSSGLPLSRTLVTVLNLSTGELRSVRTNQMGRYRVDDLTVGDFYVVTVNSPKRQFLNDTVSFTLNDAVEGIDFTALEP